MGRAERAQRQSQRLAIELLALRLVAAVRERDHQVARRDQRFLVLCAEQAGLLDEDLALDLCGIGVLALSRERGRQVAGRVERIAAVSTENAAPLLQNPSEECFRFCELS